MTHIEILTEGFLTPNGRAFLFPLVKHRRSISESGISFSLRRSGDEIKEADVIIVDSKYFRDRWATQGDEILSELALLRRRANMLVYADISDSSGWLQSRVLSAVDSYWKSMLLRDRTEYLRPIYGHRIYSDYYYRNNGVVDENPIWSLPVKDVDDLAKLRIAWNSGLADYSWLGSYRMAAYAWLPLPMLLQTPDRFVAPSAGRTIELHCRMGTNYSRSSVSFQRLQIARKLAHRIQTNKVTRRRYIQELENSKLVVSPFGYGEITLKDFEVFLTGGLLLKPDMAHLETWPDLFRAGETLVSHRWDLVDFEAKIDSVLEDYPTYIDLARTGQRIYRCYLTNPELFVSHLMALLASSHGKAPRLSEA